MELDALQSQFSENNEVSFELLAPNYPVLHIHNKFATASIALHGAHLISFTPHGEKPVIFTSKTAIYKEGKAIRGGIPICWPWFAGHPEDSSLPAHGFARNRFWTLSSIESTGKSTLVTLELPLDQSQQQTIGGKSKLSLSIEISDKLNISLTTANLGSSPITVGGALHSYFQVSNIANIRLEGLENTPYLDTITGQTSAGQIPIQISEEFDNVFLPTINTVTIKDKEWDRSIVIEKSGSEATTVWNPWIEKSKSMADLCNQAYLDFVCVEAINWASDLRTIAPEQSHTLSQSIYLTKS